MNSNNSVVKQETLDRLQELCDEFHMLDEDERRDVLITKLKRPDMRAAKQHEIEL